MKYDGLGAFLRSQGSEQITLSRTELESLVGKLPDESRTPQFWANAADYHPTRRRQWLDAGYQAFYNPRTDEVRFERQQNESGPDAGSPWTEAELRLCVSTYREMLSLHEIGMTVNKSEWRRRALDGGLNRRNKGAFEFRMQNISAVLDELGLSYLPGYLPRKNIGHAKASFAQLINEYWPQLHDDEAPTADPEELALRVSSAGVKLVRRKAALPPTGIAKPKRKVTAQLVFERDPKVIAWVLNVAAGRCEICESPAPFIRNDGEPYLEVHQSTLSLPFSRMPPTMWSISKARQDEAHLDLRSGARHFDAGLASGSPCLLRQFGRVFRPTARVDGCRVGHIGRR